MSHIGTNAIQLQLEADLAGGCFPQLRGGAGLCRIFLNGGGGPEEFWGPRPADSCRQDRVQGIFGNQGGGLVPSGKFVAPAGSPAEKWERGVICFTRAGGRGYRRGAACRWGSRGRGFMNARPGERTRAPGASRAPVFLYGTAASGTAILSIAYARREKPFVFSSFHGEGGVDGVGNTQIGHQRL